jgi:putative SOS response-associated peptidase YedK
MKCRVTTDGCTMRSDRAPAILEQEDWPLWLDAAHDPTALLASVRPERFEVRVAA